MADKHTCPDCGFAVESPGESSPQKVSSASCEKTVNESRTEAASPPTQGEGNQTHCLGCLVKGGLLLILACIGLSFPIRWAADQARRDACVNRLKLLGLAMQNYHDHYRCYPPPYTMDENGNRLHSWRTLILPFMGENNMYRGIRLDEPWDSPHNRKLGAIYTYHCPAVWPAESESETRTDYVMITGPGTMGQGTEGTHRKDITDARHATVIVAEVAQSDIHWMEPRDYDFAAGPHRLVAQPKDPIGPTSLSSCHPGVVNMLMVDGSVKCVPVDIDEKTFEAMMTIAGGEEVELE